MICLPSFLTDKFLSGLKDGSIDPEKLSSMSSEERRSFFDDFVGKDNAKDVNALFESKLLLKDQQTGLINWAKEVGGMKPEIQRDIISRINKLDTVLNPADEKSFLADLAAKKVGTEVTTEEAQKISQMAKDASRKKAAIKETDPVGSESRLAYGKAKIDFQKYVGDLKSEAEPTTVIGTIKQTFNVIRALKTAGDVSSISYQEGKSALSNPIIWMQNAMKTFADVGKSLGGQEVLDATKADIESRPNSLNGLYKKEGLAIGATEEAIPTRIQERIPIIGRILKATDEAYIGMQYRMRADVFDKMVDIANDTGGSTKGLGKVVNSLTGRGDLGKLEPAANAVNDILFPPRLLKSNIDVLTGNLLDYKDMDSFARKQAAFQSIKIISGMAAIMTLANWFKKGSATTNPTSANFGQIKTGDTAFDYSAGLGSAVVLASRLALGQTTSATTGKTTQLNTGKFGSETKMDVVQNYITGRGTAIGDLLFNWLQGTDYSGNKPFSLQSVLSDFEPYIVSDVSEAMKDPNSANLLAVFLGSALGVFPTTDTPPTKK